MDITFSDHKLERLVNDDRRVLKVLGPLRKSILRRRLTQLSDATTLDEVRHLPGNFHELLHNRKGQWACDLDQPYRLVFKPHETPVPLHEDGSYDWSKIRGVEVIEITNYH